MFLVTCWKYKVIEAVGNEVELFVMIPLQYVCASLYVSWLLFIFNVSVMFIGSMAWWLGD